DDIDLAQWYHVLNLEVEADLAPDGFGPLEIVAAFVRVEARYDCVWTHACHLFPSANVYGDEAGPFPKRLIAARLAGRTGPCENGSGDEPAPAPTRLSDARLAGRTGSLASGDHRRSADLDRTNFELGHRRESGSSREPLRLWSLPGCVSLFGNGDGPNNRFD